MLSSAKQSAHVKVCTTSNIGNMVVESLIAVRYNIKRVTVLMERDTTLGAISAPAKIVHTTRSAKHDRLSL